MSGMKKKGLAFLAIAALAILPASCSKSLVPPGDDRIKLAEGVYYKENFTLPEAGARVVGAQEAAALLVRELRYIDGYSAEFETLITLVGFERVYESAVNDSYIFTVENGQLSELFAVDSVDSGIHCYSTDYGIYVIWGL